MKLNNGIFWWLGKYCNTIFSTVDNKKTNLKNFTRSPFAAESMSGVILSYIVFSWQSGEAPTSRRYRTTSSRPSTTDRWSGRQEFFWGRSTPPTPIFEVAGTLPALRVSTMNLVLARRPSELKETFQKMFLKFYPNCLPKPVAIDGLDIRSNNKNL